MEEYATEVTDYLENIYLQEHSTATKIVSKDEHIEQYEQKLGNESFPFIAYGFGYMKVKRCKKQTISYICLLDNNCQPIWGYIIPR